MRRSAVPSPHAYSPRTQGRDHWEFGSGKDEPSCIHGQVRAINWLFIRVSFCGSVFVQFVSGHFSTAFHSTIGTGFITKTLPHSKPDESVTLLIWIRLPLPTKSPCSSPRHRSRDHRIPPDKSASRPFRPRFSVARTPSSSSSTSTSPRRLSAGGRSSVRVRLSAKMKRRNTASSWLGTRPISCPARMAVRSQSLRGSYLGLHRRTRPAVGLFIKYPGDTGGRRGLVAWAFTWPRSQWARRRGCRLR